MPPKAARNATGKGDGGYGKGGRKSAAPVNTTNLRRDMCKACQQVRAAPGPGDNMTRASLKQQWSAMKKTRVLGFYSHAADAGEHGCLSNFYEAPFEFCLPEEFCGIDLSAEERTFWVPFSEAAIMACKAAAMGDKASFVKITTSRGASQAKIKKFGREVVPFSEEIWEDIVCSVAYEVVYQKFSKVQAVQDILLRTGDCLLAEATSRDKNWGIGIDLEDKRVDDPSQWNGANILGWALMLARSKLVESKSIAVADVPLAVEAGARLEVDASESTEALAPFAIEDAKGTETALELAAFGAAGSSASSSSRKWRTSLRECKSATAADVPLDVDSFESPQAEPEQQCDLKGTTPILRGRMCQAGRQVRAAPGPGENMTRESLIQQWSTMKKTPVLGFYGHGAYAGEHGCFSNFYKADFEFQMPQEFCSLDLTADERTFWVPFSQAAIMACKAAAMGDKASFVKITTSRGATQGQIKQFGREVISFSDEIWDDIVCSVAYEVVYQKFAKLEALREILLRTGDCLIAEATRNDKNWGIGIDMGDDRVNNPRKWKGANMLGWALMLARSQLRESVSTAVADVPMAVEAGALIEVDSPECTEAVAPSGIESSKCTETSLELAASEAAGSCASSSSRKWRRKKHTKGNTA